MNITPMTPEQEGYWAWGSSFHVSDNPYPPSSRAGNAWERGWLKAEEEHNECKDPK